MNIEPYLLKINRVSQISSRFNSILPEAHKYEILMDSISFMRQYDE